MFGSIGALLSPVLVPSDDAGSSVVVVTGASSGIGRATALLVAGRGDHVVVVARGGEQLDAAAAECLDAGAASVQVEEADVGDDDAVAAMVAAVVEQHGRIDAVLHCAGIVSYGRTEETGAEDFAAVLTTNLLGSASVARHVVPVLRAQSERGRGSLVLVGSLLGHVAVPEMTPYVVSKWGVRALARQLSIENLDKPGVHIAHVAPGSVDTPIYDNALDEAGMVNTPPPPTISPERAARRVVQCIGSRSLTAQTAWSNYALIAAFTMAAPVYDRLVGPVFHAVSRRRVG